MKNLAGVEEADNYIRRELEEAGIDILTVPLDLVHHEVPFTLAGRLRVWNFERAWYYWVASAPDGEGLPLDIANELNNKRYPLYGRSTSPFDRNHKIYGEVVRVHGYAGGDSPKNWAFPKKDVLLEELKRLGIKKDLNYGQLARLCNKGRVTSPRFVNKYHIDTQEGLNQFARVVRNLYPIVESVL